MSLGPFTGFVVGLSSSEDSHWRLAGNPTPVVSTALPFVLTVWLFVVTALPLALTVWLFVVMDRSFTSAVFFTSAAFDCRAVAFGALVAFELAFKLPAGLVTFTPVVFVGFLC